MTARELYDGLRADPAARRELGGGSVTVDGGQLILVAEAADRALVRESIGEIGADWSSATISYGHAEFVS